MQDGYSGFLFIAGWAHYFYCSFPRWAQGHWENLHVNGNQLTYRDQKTFHVASVHCVGNNMGESGDKFGIYSRNQWWAKNLTIFFNQIYLVICEYVLKLLFWLQWGGQIQLYDNEEEGQQRARAENEWVYIHKERFVRALSLLARLFFYFNLDAGQFRFKRDPGWRVGGRRSAPPFVSVLTCGIHGAV